MLGKSLSIGFRAALAILAIALCVTTAWTATHERVLHAFNPNGKDGVFPYSGLIFDKAGNLYGTTETGGTYDAGTVFELTPKAGGGWTEKVLHSFNINGRDGAFPYLGGLTFDAVGNLYGTTQAGGTYNSGTVFKLTPTQGGGWTEQVLHSFNSNGTDGYYSQGGLIFDAAGNLYGTTYYGGTNDAGTVFELTPAQGGGWTEQVLYSFSYSGTDGYYPYAGLIFDGAGNLYGTTQYGGTNDVGTVFELTPTKGGGWTEQVLYSFSYSVTDGYNPYAGLIFDGAGNLYGTTQYGGTNDAGTVFELTPTKGGGWTEQVLYSFGYNGTDGNSPEAGLIFDAAGKNLYGTTYYGGTNDAGTVFELTPTQGGGWAEQVLYSFTMSGTDGAYPQAGLILDAAGNLYLPTYGGGASNSGAVFQLTPAQGGGWTEQLLYSFNFNGTDGDFPYFGGDGLIFDAAGNLYGTTSSGGTYDAGTVFQLTPTEGGGWTEKVLYSFNFSGQDGTYPNPGLIFDAAGNLYGTTNQSGAYYGPGTVFELTPQAGGNWTEQVLYSFCAQTYCTDGAYPYAGLIFDAAGNLYGTTNSGGTYGAGTVFELTPMQGGGWTEQVLYSFNYNPDGGYPYAGLIFDGAGNLYGTTEGGGTHGRGTVFELTPTQGGSWTEQVLYSFNTGKGGYSPYASLIFDAAGNLYGTTHRGGTYNGGTVFELTPAQGGGWTEKLLHSFNNNGKDGYRPYAGLIFDKAGNLYGATFDGQGRTYEAGNHNAGTVFELRPTKSGGWAEQVLYSFNGRGGANPVGGLILDAAGNLYGTTSRGGPNNLGTVFEIIH